MLQLIKKIFFGLLTGLVNGSHQTINNMEKTGLKGVVKFFLLS